LTSPAAPRTILAVFLLAIVAVFGLIGTALLTNAYLRPRSCHYCRERQPPNALRNIELSGAGAVEVCRDATACRKRHQRTVAR
jgi:hypothetical protein